MPVPAVRSGLADNPNPVDDLHGLLKVNVPLSDDEAEKLSVVATLVVRNECLKALDPTVEPDKSIHLHAMWLQSRIVKDTLSELGITDKVIIDFD